MNVGTIRSAVFRLAPTIEFEGITFSFIIYHAGASKHLALAYKIEDVLLSSSHYPTFKSTGGWDNPFTQTRCSYLWHSEPIRGTDTLEAQIASCIYFFKDSGIYQRKFKNPAYNL